MALTPPTLAGSNVRSHNGSARSHAYIRQLGWAPNSSCSTVHRMFRWAAFPSISWPLPSDNPAPKVPGSDRSPSMPN